MANEVVAVRSIEIVTAEIHTIRDNVARVFMDGVVQIGRRLEEAKQLVPQGEWLQYLDKELGYKPSTAQNYMRIAREFGDGQVGLSGKTSSDFFGNLGYSQLLPLLGLPEEEREQLAEEHDLAGMSSREIQALVKERDEAKADADKLRKKNAQLAGYKDAAKANAKTAADLQRRLAAQEAEAQEVADRAAAIQQRLDELEQQDGQPRDLTDEELAKIRADVAAEQAAAVQAAEERAAEAVAKLEKVKNPAAHRVNFLFGELGEVWQRLEAALDELAGTDAAAAARMRGAIVGAVREWLAL